MKLTELRQCDLSAIEWDSYDLILLASGFEARSTHLLQSIPDAALNRCRVLGFSDQRDVLSRPENDRRYMARGLTPLVFERSDEYERALLQFLTEATSSDGRPIRIFADYSVMTRVWYAYLLTWLRYSPEATQASVDFAYCAGQYEGEFDPLHINEMSAIPGFEGVSAGPRHTVAFFGLGHDRYATLAVYELIEPDRVVCFVARDAENDRQSDYVLQQNQEIIELSGAPPIFVSLANLEVAFRVLHEQFADVPDEDEIIAIPMGPKPHVLATMLVSHFLPRVTCLHARGRREHPVQVTATGEVSIWRAEYRIDHSSPKT